MTKRFCDICDKECLGGDFDVAFRVNWGDLGPDDKEDVPYDDACPDCARAIILFIKDRRAEALDKAHLPPDGTYIPEIPLEQQK